jgi:hypothetical protein
MVLLVDNSQRSPVESNPGQDRQNTFVSNIVQIALGVLAFGAAKSIDRFNPFLGVVFRLLSFVLLIKPVLNVLGCLGIRFRPSPYSDSDLHHGQQIFPMQGTVRQDRINPFHEQTV